MFIKHQSYHKTKQNYGGNDRSRQPSENTYYDFPSGISSHRQSILSGTRWIAARNVGSYIVRFGIIIVLARLLSPQDFGLLAMALAVTQVLEIFRALGTQTAIIQKKVLSQELLSSVFFLSCCVGILLSTIVALGGPAVAWLYGEARVSHVIKVLGLTFAISSFGLVHVALLNRAKRFNQLAIIGWAATVTNGMVAISLAFAGWGVWALVAGNIIGALTTTSVAWWFSRWRPSVIYHWSEIRKVARFSSYLVANSLYEYFTRNISIFIIGRFLGAASLGYFTLVSRLFQNTLELIMGTLRTVLFPTLSNIQDDNPQIRKLYLRACAGITFIIAPMMAGLCILASPFVYAILGEKWGPAIPLIMILTPIAAVNSLKNTVGVIYMVKGRTDWLFYWQLVSGTLTALSFLFGLPWGIVGVASAYCIITLALIYPAFRIPFSLIDLTFRDFLGSLRPYVSATSVMVLLVLGCRLVLEHHEFTPLPVLLTGTAVGFVAYSVIILLTKPPALEDFQQFLLVKGFMRRTA